MSMDFWGEFKELSESRRFQAPESLDQDSEVLSNPVCGDEVSVLIGIQDEVLSSFHYRAQACWPVFACLELLGQMFLGAPVRDPLTFNLEAFLDTVDRVPASKRHAFSLAHRAFQSAVVKAYANKLNLSIGAVGPACQERV